jgi:hypothetical protein
MAMQIVTAQGILYVPGLYGWPGMTQEATAAKFFLLVQKLKLCNEMPSHPAIVRLVKNHYHGR